MSPSVVVLDYGSGNLRSAERALARVGAQVSVTADPNAARLADGLVVPGVGAFAACLAGLSGVAGRRVVWERVRAGQPVLGICVGMQVLFDFGVEHSTTGPVPGLGVLPGTVRRLRAPILPHMGWNTVRAGAGSALFAGLDASTRFYFVHSYAVTETDGVVSTAEHGESFVAAVEHGAVAATQFHPEKSGDAGAALLANWLETLR